MGRAREIIRQLGDRREGTLGRVILLISGHSGLVSIIGTLGASCVALATLVGFVFLTPIFPRCPLPRLSTTTTFPLLFSSPSFSFKASTASALAIRQDLDPSS